MTPLMHACVGPIATFEGSLGDRTSTIWYLLDQGADIAIRNKIGETALHVAIRKGLCHCVCMCGCVLFVTEFLKKCVINVQLHSSWICQLFGQEDAKASFSFPCCFVIFLKPVLVSGGRGGGLKFYYCQPK
jgi:Ankyrin repeats (many copies)